MIGKSFVTFLHFLIIGVLQHNIAIGCQTHSDCRDETKLISLMRVCCYNAIPARCMADWKTCSNYKHTVPDFDRITPWRPEEDFNQYTVPNIPDINQYNHDYNYGNDDHNDGESKDYSGALTTFGITAGIIIFIGIISLLVLLYIRGNGQNRHLQQNCDSQPPATTNTSRTNVVAQQNEEPSRMVRIDVTRDEDHIRHQNRPPDGEQPSLSEDEILHNNNVAQELPLHEEAAAEPHLHEVRIRHQNRPPDGEPPFPSEEDILNDLHNSRVTQQPPPYEEATTEPHLPQYEGLDNAAMDQLPPPSYFEAQATSRTQITAPPVNEPPPSYEEALTSTA